MSKKLFLLLFLLLGVSLSAFSIEISSRFGRVTNDELTMTVYENDTTAAAVVLYKAGGLSYTFSRNLGFQTIFEFRKKIKVLKPEGTRFADVVIPFRVDDNILREFVSGIDAYAHNLVNGRAVRTRMSRRYIFEEELSSNMRLLRFSIPNVRAGTVIEYRYRITSPFIYDIPDWNMQRDIPVLYSRWEVLIPEYFHFRVDAARGHEHIQVVETTRSQTFDFTVVTRSDRPFTDANQRTHHSWRETSNSRALTFTGRNLPALKPEPNIWYVNDFATSVRLELTGTQFPGGLFRPFTNSWSDIENTLRRSDFGSNMRMSNPFRNEVRAIAAESSSEEETITKIYALVRERIRWNGTYAFWGNRARDAVRHGTGNNAQINMVLMSMLRDADITAYPVLMSRRDRGRLPFSPTLDRLNTFIVAAETSDGQIFYMDGSAVYGGLNVLPTVLLVDRAWAFDERRTGDKWVDLTNLGRNQHINILRVTIDENGAMTGEAQIRYVGQKAHRFKSRYFSLDDPLEFLTTSALTQGITIKTHSLEGMEPMSTVVDETFTFTKNAELAGDYMFITPMIYKHLANNPFIQSERRLPVEFDFPYSYMKTVVFTIPEGFVVDEMPAPLTISLENNAGRLIYGITQVSENTLQLTYRFELNQIIFPQSDYPMIREFFGQVASKNREMIVLRRNNP